MDKQIIITIAREYGSGGHEIGQKLAEELGIKFYDRNLLEEVALGKNVDSDLLTKYDEIPNNFLTTRNVRGFSNSPEENVAYLQFDFLKKQAEEGKSFIVVGRCGGYVLRNYPNVIRVFVMGDYESKLDRIMELYHLSAKDAAVAIVKKDKYRRNYNNHYADYKWGDSRNYDLCLNTTKIGVDGGVKVLNSFLKNI